MQDYSLSSLGMQDHIWKLYRTDNPYLHEKTIEIPHMKRLCFETIHKGRIVTLGVYEYKEVEVLKAWGYKDSEHCSYHAIKTNKTWSEVIEGCPDFKVSDKGFDLTTNGICHMTDKEPQTFDLYTPLLSTALFSFVLGGLITYFQMITLEMFLMNSMGVFITILGLLKIKDIPKFAIMFKQYDPLARQVSLYANMYPYLETTIGVFILSGLFLVTTQVAVIIMYTCTTIGIIYSLSSGKKLECGCLGGNIKLPLSKVTIFENLTMVLMAVYMLITFVN